jgi:hypothetical protein
MEPNRTKNMKWKAAKLLIKYLYFLTVPHFLFHAANKQQRISNLQVNFKHYTGIYVSTYLKKSDPSKNPPNLTEGGVIVRFTVKIKPHHTTTTFECVFAKNNFPDFSVKQLCGVACLVQCLSQCP